jgi:hypothetical protein
MNLTKGLKDILKAFNAHPVQYLIIGAHALGVYAEPRSTKDLDELTFEEAWLNRVEGELDLDSVL